MAVAIVSGVISATLSLVRLYTGQKTDEADFDPNADITDKTANRDSQQSYDGRMSGVVNLNNPNTEMFSAIEELEIGFSGGEGRASNIGRSSVVRQGSMAGRASLTISRVSTIRAETRDSQMARMSEAMNNNTSNTNTIASNHSPFQLTNVSNMPTSQVDRLSRISEEDSRALSVDSVHAPAIMAHFELDTSGQITGMKDAKSPGMAHFELDTTGQETGMKDDKPPAGNGATAAASKPTVVGTPFVPTMPQLTDYWTHLALFFAVVNFLFPSKNRHIVIGFQLCATMVVFLWSTVYRNYLIGNFHNIIQIILQAVVLFTPVMIFVAIFSSMSGCNDWELGLKDYHTGKTVYYIKEWGPGDFISIFLNPAIVSLAFASVDAFIEYAALLPILVPAIAASCVCITVQAAVLSHILESPKIISLSLLTRTVTTPVAINLSTLTGASPAIVAASTVINGVINYRTVPHVLTLLRVTNPLSRGISAAVSGTLMGVVAMDENGEPIAAGIGMAGFGIATILYALLMAITGFQDFLTQFS